MLGRRRPDIASVIILLFGPPGCGKGVQSAFISSRFGIPAISTGELFRAECKAGTALGREACAILSVGGLVGDEIVNAILAGRIGAPDCASGILLDGYPRTLPQALFLDRLLEQREGTAVVKIHLDVPVPIIVERITLRRQCPVCSRIYNLLSQPPRTPGVCDSDGTHLVAREDDREDVIRRRLELYEEQTGPVLQHYQGRHCYRIDGAPAPEEISKRIARVLEQYEAVQTPSGR